MMRTLLVAIAVVSVLGVGGVDAAPEAPRPALSIEVTGNPAPIETLRRGIVAALRVSHPQASNARTELFWTNPELAPVPAGSSVTANAGFLTPLRGLPPVTFSMPVTLTNVPLGGPQRTSCWSATIPRRSTGAAWSTPGHSTACSRCASCIIIRTARVIGTWCWPSGS